MRRISLIVAIAAVASGTCTEAALAKAKTTVKITYVGGTDDGFAVIGKVTSPKKGCLDGRKVSILVGGQRVGHTRTYDDYFSADADGTVGDYTAVVKETGGCKAATSKIYRYDGST